MANDESIKKLPVRRILEISVEYVRNNLKTMMAFTLANFFLLVLGIEIIRPLAAFLLPQVSVGGIGVDLIGNVAFLLWSAGFYIFWCFFFRFYYDRHPYLMFRKIFDSLVPSTKILFMTFLFVTILAVLPYAPLFMGMPLDKADEYMHFLDSIPDLKMLDFFLTFILILVSPLIFYRPFMAWISAVIGRSGLLKTALLKTRGNYWNFVAIMALFNVPVLLLEQLTKLISGGDFIFWFLVSPLIVLFNVVIAKSYDFFFLDTLED